MAKTPRTPCLGGRMFAILTQTAFASANLLSLIKYFHCLVLLYILFCYHFWWWLKIPKSWIDPSERVAASPDEKKRIWCILGLKWRNLQQQLRMTFAWANYKSCCRKIDSLIYSSRGNRPNCPILDAQLAGESFVGGGGRMTSEMAGARNAIPAGVQEYGV